MKLNQDKDTFLSLVRLGIGHEAEVPETVNWTAVKELATVQGVGAIVFDAVRSLEDRGLLTDGRRMGVAFHKHWAQSVKEMYEGLYEDYRTRIGQLAYFYNTSGFKLMVLKGYGLSLCYPIPSHRPVGDIDIWAFGRYKEADAAINRELGLSIDDSHHHHTVFYFMDYMVENHYDWVNVHTHKSNIEMEKIFKELAMDDSYSVVIDDEKVYLPSPNLHALFLLRHSMSHFASTSMVIRQLLDWGFYAQAHVSEIDWKWLQDTLERFHMREFFMYLNNILVKDFGFSPDIFPPIVLQDPAMSDRILGDMLFPEFQGKTPRKLLPRIWFKYRRWRANKWKHHLCYAESMFGTFLTSARAHLMKPSSI